MVHRPLVQCVKLMLSEFSNTSDIERSYPFLEIFKAIWREGEVPQEFKDADIVHL